MKKCFVDMQLRMLVDELKGDLYRRYDIGYSAGWHEYVIFDLLDRLGYASSRVEVGGQLGWFMTEPGNAFLTELLQGEDDDDQDDDNDNDIEQDTNNPSADKVATPTWVPTQED